MCAPSFPYTDHAHHKKHDHHHRRRHHQHPSGHTETCYCTDWQSVERSTCSDSDSDGSGGGGGGGSAGGFRALKAWCPAYTAEAGSY